MSAVLRGLVMNGGKLLGQQKALEWLPLLTFSTVNDVTSKEFDTKKLAPMTQLLHVRQKLITAEQ